MPREEIDLRYRIDYLSILDADGGVDDPLVPDAVVTAGNFITSRYPGDLPSFIDKMLQTLRRPAVAL
jgi:putative intracellular protease/amidase